MTNNLGNMHQPTKLLSELYQGGLKSAPSFEEKSVSISTPEVTTSIKFSGDEEVSIFEDGPDQILPSEALWTSEADGRVRLQVAETSGVAAQPPISVPGLLHRTATRYPNHQALQFKDADGSWTAITFKEYEENVRTVAKAFIQLGLQKYHGVCIIGFNSPEWFYADLGAIYAGAEIRKTFPPDFMPDFSKVKKVAMAGTVLRDPLPEQQPLAQVLRFLV
ncbi:acyl-CoA synthetase bubblegum member [Homalodisca vitripennis]|nr:acyl-CoA synthetase bubblegum member [Homalodisca vitripennis]